MLRAIFDSVSPCATLYVPSGAGAADSLLLGAGALATGGGLGGVLAALEARLPVRPARARGAGLAAAVESLGEGVAAGAGAGRVRVCAGEGAGAVVAAATGAAELARSPGV